MPRHLCGSVVHVEGRGPVVPFAMELPELPSKSVELYLRKICNAKAEKATITSDKHSEAPQESFV